MGSSFPTPSRLRSGIGALPKQKSCPLHTSGRARFALGCPISINNYQVMAAPVPIPRSEGTTSSGPHFTPAASLPTRPDLQEAIDRQGSDVFDMDDTLETLEVPPCVIVACPQDIESPTSAEIRAARNTALRVTQLADPRDEHERRVLAAARAAKKECTGKMGVDIKQVYERMLARGYDMELHETTHHSGPRPINKNCLEKLTHTFLVCKGHKDCKDLTVQGDLIVDPEFRSHFQIGQENPIYTMVVNLIPDEFVGPVMRLRAVVEAMSNAMTYAFRARGMPPPPWRKLRSILSKWGVSPDKRESAMIPTSPVTSPRVSTLPQAVPPPRSMGFSISPPSMPQTPKPRERSTEGRIHGGNIFGPATASSAVRILPPAGKNMEIVSALTRSLRARPTPYPFEGFASFSKRCRSPASGGPGCSPGNRGGPRLE